MSPLQALAVFFAGIWAGTINTVVGSGTLVSFPVLLAIGLPPVTANVTNTLGLVPGSITGAIGYRDQLRGQRRVLIALGLASAIGGIVGAVLLLTLPGSAFKTIVPVLIVLALVMVVFQPLLARRLGDRTDTNGDPAGTLGEKRDEPTGEPAGTRGDRADTNERVRVTPLLWLLVLGTGVYGGYFGAAQGVLLLAIMGVLLDESLQRANATKNVLAAIVNGVAAVVFIFTAHIQWTTAAVLAAGAIIGGLLGARLGKRLSPPVMRAVIVVVGLAAIAKLVW